MIKLLKINDRLLNIKFPSTHHYSFLRLLSTVSLWFPESTSQIIEGKYGETSTKIIYGALTTPDNAIGGSAICVFQMDNIEEVFRGPFKHQESINANWLPVPDNKVPEPRPGECVRDSRILPDANVNFIKTHPLMEKAVPSYHGRPILIRVSLNYRFTAIAVDPQVRTVNDETFDIIYIGTGEYTAPLYLLSVLRFNLQPTWSFAFFPGQFFYCFHLFQIKTLEIL